MRGNMEAKFNFIFKLILVSLILICISSCDSGSKTTKDSTTNSSSLSLDKYVNSLEYKSSVNNYLHNDLTFYGNANSFTVIAPVLLESIHVIYYTDSICNTSYKTTVIGSGTPAQLQAGTYTRSDQANYYLCDIFDSGGCSDELSSAQAGTYKSIQFKYNFTNGAYTLGECLYNNSLGYEVLANFTDPQNPTACTNVGSGSTLSCGYSESHFTTLSIPFISTNGNSSCSLNENSTNNMSCWGGGTNGQIGNGANSNVNVPTAVTMPSGVNSFTSVSTNAVFTCALAGTGINAGKIYCWGLGNSGQIGNGANLSVNVPTLVTMPSGVDNFTSVSTNILFSCAIAGAGVNVGKVYCWGVGTNGQIGNGANSNVNVPTLVTMPSGVNNFASLSSSFNFSCAIAGSGVNSGKIYCWGRGTSGQIGNGSDSNVNVPTSVIMPSGVNSFNSVSNNSASSCAIAESGVNAGKVYCWGYGPEGQIGNGANSNVNVPTSVIMPSGVNSFGSVVSTNPYFSCAIASNGSNAGKVYCWGSGTEGQIGNGANSNVNVPTLTQ